MSRGLLEIPNRPPGVRTDAPIAPARGGTVSHGAAKRSMAQRTEGDATDSTTVRQDRGDHRADVRSNALRQERACSRRSQRATRRALASRAGPPSWSTLADVSTALAARSAGNPHSPLLVPPGENRADLLPFGSHAIRANSTVGRHRNPLARATEGVAISRRTTDRLAYAGGATEGASRIRPPVRRDRSVHEPLVRPAMSVSAEPARFPHWSRVLSCGQSR